MPRLVRTRARCVYERERGHQPQPPDPFIYRRAPCPNFHPRHVAAFVDVLRRWFSINGLFERERGFQ